VSGTRGLVSKLPRWMWSSATDVVAYGIDAVMDNKSRVIAVPGRVNRLIANLARFLPNTLVQWTNRRTSKFFRAQKKTV
jgi:short-subunit dehydrogenase